MCIGGTGTAKWRGGGKSIRRGNNKRIGTTRVIRCIWKRTGYRIHRHGSKAVGGIGTRIAAIACFWEKSGRARRRRRLVQKAMISGRRDINFG